MLPSRQHPVSQHSTGSRLHYLINQTLGGRLVRALRARAGILLLINQPSFHGGSGSVKMHQKSPFSLLYLNHFITSSYHENTTR